jgi:hypothetical protein
MDIHFIIVGERELNEDKILLNLLFISQDIILYNENKPTNH